MVKIFRMNELEIEERPSPIPDFLWKRSAHLGELADAQYLHFDILVLPPDKFSYPYHSHRNAEELFYIIEGAVMLRTPLGIETVHQGDLLHFEQGAAGAHQLYNHTDTACVYLDIRTKANVDVCDYPDSGKVNILPAQDIFETDNRVAYFEGEQDVRDKWPDALVRNRDKARD